MVTHRFNTPKVPKRNMKDPTAGRRAIYCNVGVRRSDGSTTLGSSEQRDVAMAFMRGGSAPAYSHTGTGNPVRSPNSFGVLHTPPLLPFGHALLGSAEWDTIQNTACDMLHGGTPYSEFTTTCHMNALRKLYSDYAKQQHELSEESLYLHNLDRPC
jgi:hypothetical protein